MLSITEVNLYEFLLTSYQVLPHALKLKVVKVIYAQPIDSKFCYLSALSPL
jgi:hypothetical protein